MLVLRTVVLQNFNLSVTDDGARGADFSIWPRSFLRARLALRLFLVAGRYVRCLMIRRLGWLLGTFVHEIEPERDPHECDKDDAREH